MTFDYNENACRIIKQYFEGELVRAQDEIRRLESEKNAAPDLRARFEKEAEQAHYKYYEAFAQIKIHEMNYYLENSADK